MASIGLAVGLGNLWRFPYIAGLNGGGAFVLLYIGFVVVICLPIIAAELCLGRHGGQSPIATMVKLVGESRGGGIWLGIGWLSVLIPFLAITYYSVVAGWSFEYFARAASGDIAGLGPEASARAFDELQSNPGKVLLLQMLFIGLTVVVVGAGIRKGIERTTRILMPGLFISLLLLVGYAAVAGDFERALRFLFNLDFAALRPRSILMALGQAFFSVGVGVGGMITYSAYTGQDLSIPRSAAFICAVDTLVSILAGLAIFPIVFASGLDPSGGPGLIFVTLPVAFGGMPWGSLFGAIFFVLFFFAGFTSSIAMLEPVVSWLEEHLNWRRIALAGITGLAAAVVGVAPALSFNLWSDLTLPAGFGAVAGWNIFQIIDGLVANLILPVNAVLIALFAGWIMPRATMAGELGLGGRTLVLWQISVRILAPLAIAAIVGFWIYEVLNPAA